jgi:uncharacterized membrane protein
MTLTDDETVSGFSGERLAAGLGWFSLGLGLAEMAAPDVVARLMGAVPTGRMRTTLRVMGAREVAAGLGILMRPDPTVGVWSRVAGDAVDLALLGAAFTGDHNDRSRTALATAVVAGVTAADVISARALGRRQEQGYGTRDGRVHVEYVATIARPIGEVYQFWRDFQNFPRFMRQLESVRELGPRRSRWRARGPGGMTIEWDAEILSERQDEMIAWRSVEGSDVRHSGAVIFEHAPGARGTEVRVVLEYVPPAGSLGRAVAWLFGQDPRQQVREDLRRFKQIMETGEVALSDGPGLGRPAQPVASAAQARRMVGVQP